MSQMFMQCKQTEIRQTSTSTWHVMFGWTDKDIDKRYKSIICALCCAYESSIHAHLIVCKYYRLMDGLFFVRCQFQLVSQKAFVDNVFKPLLKLVPETKTEGK